jgi:hypothetical protein
MYVATETGTERSMCIEQVLEDIPGGGVIEPDDFKSDTTEMEEGAVVGVDSNGIYHLVKTAKIVAGGSASAPRIELEHELVVGDVISDGVKSLEIDAITEGTTYDTLGFDSGDLAVYAAGTILYVVETVDTTGSGNASKATVQDTSGDYLVVSIPAWAGASKANGLNLTIEQAADDVLAVAFASGVLTISLADSTAANNNLAAIQAAIRALGEVDGIDFAEAVCTGTDWDDKQTGATLTTATDEFALGLDAVRPDPLYTPSGIAMQSVDISVANQGCGVMIRGTVNESLMPFYVDADLKALLPFINFK